MSRQQRLTCIVMILSVLYLLTTAVAMAGEEEAASPSEENLARLEQQMANDPKNLDYAFEYAQMATALGRYDLAEQAYQQMLEKDSSLDRVKLDLSVLYIRQNQPAKAKVLLEEVLAANPPEEVRQNINQMLTLVNKAQKTSQFSGSLTLGYNNDSNANSSSSTGNVKFNDIIIPLEGGSLKKSDNQGFVAATLGHAYRAGSFADGKVDVNWNTDATIYKTEQARLNSLNLLLLALKTGPVFTLKEYNTTVGFTAGYNYITLDDHEYLDVASGDIAVNYALTERLSFQTGLGYEQRWFVNSPTVTTFTERTGSAQQIRVGATYIVTDQDLLTISGFYRRENTRREYNDNEQLSASGSYTHLWNPKTFINLMTSFKDTKYDGPDTFVSASIRHDQEHIAGITLGRQLPYNLNATLGYQYTNVHSSLENYEYENHRISTSTGWRF